MLMKQTPKVNFINIFCSLLFLISFCQKVTKLSCNQRKAAQFAFVQKRVHKMLVKLTPNDCGIRTVFFKNDPNIVCLSKTVVLNRGAVRQCQGCRQLSFLQTLRPILVSRGARVPANIDIDYQGCLEAKKVEKH